MLKCKLLNGSAKFLHTTAGDDWSFESVESV